MFNIQAGNSKMFDEHAGNSRMFSKPSRMFNEHSEMLNEHTQSSKSHLIITLPISSPSFHKTLATDTSPPSRQAHLMTRPTSTCGPTHDRQDIAPPSLSDFLLSSTFHHHHHHPSLRFPTYFKYHLQQLSIAYINSLLRPETSLTIPSTS